MKKTCWIFICLIFASTLSAQDLDRRYSFAETYFGIDLILVPSLSDGSFLNNNSVEPFARSGFATPAINIGATHFWGHADFFVSITTRDFKFEEDRVANSTRFGAITGLRVYPWKIEAGRIRPFAGYKFSPVRYRQENLEGLEHLNTSVRSMIDLGLALKSDRYYAYVSWTSLPNSGKQTYLSRTMEKGSSVPSGFLSLGINVNFETTRGSYSAPVARLDSMLNAANTMGFFYAVGPSTVFTTQNSSYLENNLPFLDQRTMPSIFPDFALGYHFSKQDAIVALSFRPIRQQRKAFNYDLNLKRRSLLLETYKYLFDYHGFAPFLGGGVSREWIRVEENDGVEEFSRTLNQLKWNPVVTFGWDIRPGKKADAYLLRTNLRWSPALYSRIDGARLSMQQLEFNFIQMVWYPQRKNWYKSR